MIKNSFILLTVVLLAAGCEHDPLIQPVETIADNGNGTGNGNNNGNGNNGNNNPPQNNCDPNVVYFNQDILPFLVSNCAKSGCHDAATHEEGIILDSYANVMATADVQPYNLSAGDLYEVITETDPRDRMPPAPADPLTQQQISMISTWIMQGAQDLTCTNNTCDSTGVSFAASIQPVIQNKCAGCHGLVNPGGGILLNNYSNIAAVAQNGKLLATITHTPGVSPMPKNGAMLSDCEIGMIRNWIGEGIQNN